MSTGASKKIGPRVSLVLLAWVVAGLGCGGSEADSDVTPEASGESSVAASLDPLESATTPWAWSFDDCQVDPDWQALVTNADTGETHVEADMTPVAQEGGGCAAQLDFGWTDPEMGAFLPGTRVGFALGGPIETPGFALSLRARFPSCDPVRWCRWEILLNGYVIDAPAGVLLSAHGLEAEAWNGALDVRAFSGVPSPALKATVALDAPAEASIDADEWHAYALVVDPPRGRLALWVDGVLRGAVTTDYEILGRIDALTVYAESRWWPHEGNPEPASLLLDDVRVYGLSADALAALAE